MEELRGILRELKNPWLAFAVVMMIALIVLLFNIPVARAQDNKHPPEHQSLHSKFYKNWMMPDNRAMSCCHDEDCSPSQSKLVDGQWFARKSDDEDWVAIPKHKIETERDSPDGRSHLCGKNYSGGWVGGAFTVFCFLPASGS